MSDTRDYEGGGGHEGDDRFRSLNRLTGRVIGAAIAVHRELGAGLLESAYGSCFAAEMEHEGIPFEREVAVPLVYRGRRLDCGYRLDFLVAGQVIVEVKAVAALTDIFVAQAITYLRLTRHPIALLINFNVAVLKNGIRRVVL